MADLASLRASAFDSQPPDSTALRIHALGPSLRLVLRAKAPATVAAGAAFGPALPEQACRAAENGMRAALWLGPDEWLLIASESESPALPAALERALAGKPHALVDVSHRDAGLEIAGPMAATALNAGCPLDLDPEAFPPGACARTLFAKCEITLWRRDAARFHVLFARSFAAYMSDYLDEVRRELAAAPEAG